MKSTGEVMGIDTDFGRAYCKAQLGALQEVPVSGTVFISVKNADKTQLAVSVAHQLHTLGFSIISTAGTADFLKSKGTPVEVVRRVSEDSPDLLERIREGRIQLIVNTPSGKGPLGRRGIDPRHGQQPRNPGGDDDAGSGRLRAGHPRAHPR